MKKPDFIPQLPLLSSFDKDSENKVFSQLKNLYLADQRTRFPSIPEYGIVLTNYSDKTTNGLTKCVIEYVRLKGYFVERTGNEGRIIDDRQTVTDCLGRVKIIGTIKRIRSSGTIGTSDLKAIIQGEFVAIKIKCSASNDRQSIAQRKYQLNVERNGGVYYITTDFTSFLQWFTQSFGEVGK